MAKTCRACKHTDPGCLIRIRGEQGLDCYYYEARETPLLVDVLAEVMTAILNALTSHWFVYTKLPGSFQSCESDEQKAEELVDRAYVLLARHQKEVGDA